MEHLWDPAGHVPLEGRTMQESRCRNLAQIAKESTAQVLKKDDNL